MRSRWRTGRGGVVVAAGLLMAGLLAGCLRGPERPAAGVEREDAPDYGDPANWVLRPEAAAARQGLDVFYIYPTVVADKDRPLMSWTDGGLREKTERIARQQTGMVDGFANVYAPYVRQLEFFRAMEALRRDSPDDEAMRTGADDTRAAFRHYLAHDNGGRPFVLLGHSQGAMDLFQMMKEDFDELPAATNLVAAYLIGMAIREEDLAGHPHLRLARGADDTGVIVTYNAEALVAVDTPFTGPGTYGINPLNWRTDEEPAASTLHLGAVFFDETGAVEREVPEFCEAVFDAERGALIVEPADGGAYDAPAILGEGVYHMNDLYFFYRNLAQNARDRAAAWAGAESGGAAPGGQ